MKPKTYSTPTHLVVITGGTPATSRLLEAVAEFALHFNVYLINGSSRANSYLLKIDLQMNKIQPEAVFKRIVTGRAYTCWQLADFLDEILIKGRNMPVFVLDFLETFYDESIPAAEVRELLDHSLQILQAISTNVPVMVSAQLPRGRLPLRRSLFRRLCQSANSVVEEGFINFDDRRNPGR